MLSLILEGKNKGQVKDLIHERPLIYTAEGEEYTISEFVELDLIEYERETQVQNIERALEKINVITRYMEANGK